MKRKILQKIGIYSPYFNIGGGGERYLLRIAESLSKHHHVTLLCDGSVKMAAYRKFNIDLDRVIFDDKEKILQKNIFHKYSALHEYDIFFYMTDGSIFFPFAKNNYLIIQSPVHTPTPTIVSRVKLNGWKILCYSSFMKEIIKKKLGKSSYVLSPSVNIHKLRNDTNQKKNIILSVGRYFKSSLHDKKHGALIEIFKKNYEKYFLDWKLVIAGGLTEKSGKKVVEKYKDEAKGYPIKIEINLPFNDLVHYFQTAKIYWHAAGFGEDKEEFPERMEHFGITTLEAMATGCVPVVFRGGGQLDIINDGSNGFFWQSADQLTDKTVNLITNNSIWQQMSKKAIQRAEEFSDKKFDEKLEKIF